MGILAIVIGAGLKINGNPTAHYTLYTGLLLEISSVIGLILYNLSKHKFLFKELLAPRFPIVTIRPLYLPVSWKKSVYSRFSFFDGTIREKIQDPAKETGRTFIIYPDKQNK